MFKQRFQSQTLLACLFNYISGMLQLSSKSGLCFQRLLEFSAHFDPAASIQFNNSISTQSTLLKPLPALLLNSPGTEFYNEVFLFIFTFWALCHSSQQFWHTYPGVWKVLLVTQSAIESKHIPLCLSLLSCRVWQVMEKIPTSTWAVPWHGIIQRADLQK